MKTEFQTLIILGQKLSFWLKSSQLDTEIGVLSNSSKSI